ncbi:hypothetical protein Sru01_33580 [Sphaerisporangium rufum]|uniref:Hydrogenase assembly protein HupF n=1 Tax=Sphaerisporangium rufum TaxID=1381558 RepID=A0A919R4R7_9ACTN|nr:HypC/HybG/HupF family hydrogenase formation chaperone [Sphaerisporangium rufum]GII78376.1 hypothetical protein Sru01_33580 [Sphaerisporangium rufum]
MSGPEEELPGDRGPAGCLTCSDQALPAVVVERAAGGMAIVEIGGVCEPVSVALVDAEPGDTVLVHAKEAIAVTARRNGGPEAGPACRGEA